MDPQKRKARAAAISIASNSTLVVGKLAIGLVIGSVSVMSEAIHSGVDLLAAVIAFFAVRSSGQPADEVHPFGHGKYENISGAIEALLIFVAAGWIVYEAVHRLMAPEPMEMPLLGLAVMGVSAGVNIAVSRMLMRVGKQTDSMALVADAWHLRTDVWTSADVMAGLGAIWIARLAAPSAEIGWIDPVVAIGVAALIVRAAWKLTRESVRDLLDERLPEGEEAWIRDYVASRAPVVRSFHRLRTRKSGAVRFVDLHVVVDPQMTVQASHDIAEEISARIREHFGSANVIVHIEPCDGSCRPPCESGCLLSAEERAAAKAGAP